ncbi:crossover junction endodeoxyribonuclease RuvC [candidate division WWE3 bacterium]|uniref:Crossover junction endodeoxyribonuclease RuvC n=1 Tax=candidate division WWE3 bacterium TaxID=2053526 RepID=A0A955LKH7_UNCKA|nr:crossover junction endodeoxyribonuclease RuvC [candidate division WWE3 bacterium]
MSSQKKAPEVILGIDPGLADCGWGVIKKISPNNSRLQRRDAFEVVDFGSIKTSSKDPLTIRLSELYEKMQGVIQKHKPDAVGIEELFFGKNAKTAMMVGEARGVVMLLLAQNSFSPVEFKPAEIKLALSGYGNADKKQMQEMVKLFLKLEKIPKSDDAADALAVAITLAVTKRFRNIT